MYVHIKSGISRELIDEEVSERLEMKIEEYNDLMMNIHQRHRVLSLDNFDSEDESYSAYQIIKDATYEQPDEEIESREKTDQILNKITS